MIISFQTEDRTYEIDADRPLDLSIPLKFNGPQPNSYDVERATAKPCEAGDLIGDTRRGGSCNFEQYTFIPHCNGTHTECVGHITRERISVRECLQDALIPARLISVTPVSPAQTRDTYPTEPDETDRLITRDALERALANPKSQIPNPKSLIVRTLPNDERKLTRRYMENPPAFFSTEAIEFIAGGARNIRHLLTDLPSLDRTFDGGRLSNHRVFWNVAPGRFELNANSRPERTITEMIYVPEAIADGAYLLNLQIAPFAADASPSRPLLFRLMS